MAGRSDQFQPLVEPGEQLFQRGQEPVERSHVHPVGIAIADRRDPHQGPELGRGGRDVVVRDIVGNGRHGADGTAPGPAQAPSPGLGYFVRVRLAGVFRGQDTFAILLAIALTGVAGVTGCGSSASGTASAAGASGAPTGAAASGRSLALSADAVGTLEIGADRQTTEAELIALLGKPDKTTDGPGCSLDTPVPHERALYWGDFHVLLASPEANDPGVRLSGWSLTGTSVPVPVVLPHGVTLGSSTGQGVLGADKAATLEQGLDPGRGVVVDADEVSYGLAGPDATSKVTDVTFGIDACD